MISFASSLDSVSSIRSFISSSRHSKSSKRLSASSISVSTTDPTEQFCKSSLQLAPTVIFPIGQLVNVTSFAAFKVKDKQANFCSRHSMRSTNFFICSLLSISSHSFHPLTLFLLYHIKSKSTIQERNSSTLCFFCQAAIKKILLQFRMGDLNPRKIRACVPYYSRNMIIFPSGSSKINCSPPQSVFLIGSIFMPFLIKS